MCLREAFLGFVLVEGCFWVLVGVLVIFVGYSGAFVASLPVSMIERLVCI